ncbi:MAG: replication initiator protein A [Clostridia bacterium]|nr:replication initiator protein A [Clostridia bacterium]
MEFDYFYGQQSEQFSFYRIPKMLFTDDRFWNVSTDAKLLYGILLDRMNLSARNGWMDAAGRVYIIFTLEETMAALNCGDNKATKLYNELEKKCGLIERKRQGLGKPNLIYLPCFLRRFNLHTSDIFKHPAPEGVAGIDVHRCTEMGFIRTFKGKIVAKSINDIVHQCVITTKCDVHLRAFAIHLGQGAVIGIGIEALWTRHGWLVSEHRHSHSVNPERTDFGSVVCPTNHIVTVIFPYGQIRRNRIDLAIVTHDPLPAAIIEEVLK